MTDDPRNRILPEIEDFDPVPEEKPAGRASAVRRDRTDTSGQERKPVRKDGTERTRMLAPLAPILVLLIVILLANPAKTEKEEATVAAEPGTEAETTLSAEEIADAAYMEKVGDSIRSYRNFGVALSDGTVNFRSTPDNSTSENKIGQLGDLTVFEQLGAEDGWLKIRTGGTEGYVSADYCVTGEEGYAAAKILLGMEAARQLSSPGIVRTEGNEINVFSEMHANDMSLVIGRLEGGAAFDVEEELDDWLKITSGGITGYIRTEQAACGEEAERIAAIKSVDRANITGSQIFVRSDPHYRQDNIVGTVYAGQSFEYDSTEEITDCDGTGWVRIFGDFLTEDGSAYLNTGGNNAETVFGLARASKTDAKELVVDEYFNLIICTTKGYVNIRKSTNTDSYKNIIGKIYPGNGAELLGVVEPGQSENGKKWYKISSGPVTGYVSAGDDQEAYFATGDEAADVATRYAHLTASITADRLNVRSTPSLEDNSNVWTQVTRGQAYEVLEQNGDWVKIDLGSEGGNEAYISKNDSFIRISYGLDEAIEYSYAEKASAFRQSVVDYACRFIGNPYVWGGTSLTKGCDCSGFVQQIMKHYGISMERSSYYQAQQGVKRTSSTMRPGDLIFYADSSGTVNHVVIYIGGGYMVGAQSKRSGIKVYKWNYRTPVAIRDVIGDRVE